MCPPDRCAARRFALLCRIRIARAIAEPALRAQWTRARLLALTALLHSCADAEELTAFFANEPGFSSELVSLLGSAAASDAFRSLALRQLAAQARSAHKTRLKHV